MKKLLIAILLGLSMSAMAADVCVPNRAKDGSIARSRAEVNHFRKFNACPATGNFKGACPGYQVDHIKPLCACGADSVTNMQWLDTATHKAKTKKDVALCRAMRK